MGEDDSTILASGGVEVVIGRNNPSYNMDESAVPNGSRNGHEDDDEVEIQNPTKEKKVRVVSSNDDDDYVRYGWFTFRPACLQFLNNPKAYLVFLSWFALVQGMTVNGFIYVITSTLERRFVLPSVQSGSISSCYDFSVMVVIIFVTYLGENGHKPKWLGTGSFIFVLGSITFMLPHILTPDYNVSLSDIDTCDPSRDEPAGCQADDTDLSRYFWMFVGAQALHGIGASPLFTIGITYLDENVNPKSVSIYVGIFQAITTLGPAIGYLVGGSFLGIYTDIQKEAPSGITEDHPLWVGAWWLGLVMSACLGILMVLPLYGFPKYMKDHKRVAAMRVAENQAGTDFEGSEGVKGSLKNFPKAIWNLIKNLPFMFINFASTTEFMILSSVAAFGPKFMESQFNLSAGTAAILAGAITVPAGLLGALIGGIIVKKFGLKFLGQIRLCFGSLIISLVLMVGFLFSCKSISFAGVNVEYINTTIAYQGPYNITSDCNSGCQCDTSYNPVCGNDNVMYYSSCHAGCTVKSGKNDDGIEVFSSCGCLPLDNTNGSAGALAGKCTEECGNIWLFVIMIFLMQLFTFIAVVPTITATIRCVSYRQRTVALGVQSLIYRALGTVPGPIIFGGIIDKSCILWESSCDDARQCWFYNNEEMSINVFILLACLKFGSIVFYILSSLTYRPPPGDEANASREEENSEITKSTDL